MRNLAIYVTCLLATLLALMPSAAAAISGSPPKNLRVTGVTDWTVDLKWDAPKGKTPTSYVIQSSTGATMTVPGSQTTATFSNGFDYNRTYSFRAFAVTGGSWSGASNTVTATLLKDVTPPTKPVVSNTGSGPTHVDIAWSTVENSTNLRTDIYVDGVRRYFQVPDASATLLVLRPGITYSVQVQVRDGAGNVSPMSDPLAVATPAADPNDNVAPTTPPGVWGDIVDDSTLEVMLSWGHSTDNVTSQDFIEYYVVLNGVVDGGAVGTFHNHRHFLYLERGIVNTVEVFARDEAGNVSISATLTFDMRGR